MSQSKLTYDQILGRLKEYFDNEENDGEDYGVAGFAYGDFNQEDLNLGSIKEVSSYGGEGCGDTWYTVHYFVDHDIYVRVDGFYSSYSGVDFDEGWDSCSEVRPIEKTITVYE